MASIAQFQLDNPINLIRLLSTMASDSQFEGWCGLDKHSANGKMVWQGYDPKPFNEDDVDIEISHCGVCGSDIHVLRSGWGPTGKT